MPPKYPDVTKKEYDDRISKAQALLKKSDMEALLITSAVNTYYFTGFDSLMLFPPEADQLYTMVIRRDGDPVVVMGGPQRSFEECAWPTDLRNPKSKAEYPDLIAGIWKELKLKGANVGAELGYDACRVHMPGKVYLDIVKESNIVDGSSLINDVRIVKSPEELRRMRQAAKISERAFERLLPKIKVGITERKIANLLGSYMLDEGADRPYYLLVRAAERYHNALNMVLPYDKKVRKGEHVKIEFSADYRHYVNEAKALVVVGGRPNAAEKEHYQNYVDAMRAGAKTARQGATAADVFEAQKKTFEEAGVKIPAGRGGGGHGTGLDCHEPPRLRPDDKTPLKAGMVIVVEPSGIPNKDGLVFGQSNTIIVRDSGPAERLPPLSEQILTA